MWFCKITWHTATITYLLPQSLGCQTWQDNDKLGWALTHNLSQVAFYSSSLVISCDKIKPFYFHYHDTFHRETLYWCDYHEGIPSIQSNDNIITWSWEIVWLNQNIISPLPQCLWPQKLAEWWLTFRGF